MHAAARAGEPFELVVLDGQMPGMDGIELAQAISLAPSLRGARLVMLTSTTDRRAAAREAGIAHYLQKPVRRARLLETDRRGAGRGARTDAPPRRRSAPPAAPREGAILVAEDNVVNQRVAEAMLTKRGFEVECAEQRPRGDLDARRAPVRARAHGLPDAGDGRLRGDAGDPLHARAAPSGCRSSP